MRRTEVCGPAGVAASVATDRAAQAAGPGTGRIVVQLPASVHRALVTRAAAERMSVNQLILSYVARGLDTDPAEAIGAGA